MHTSRYFLALLLLMLLSLPQKSQPSQAVSREEISERASPEFMAAQPPSMSWATILRRTSAPSGWNVSPCDVPTNLCIYARGQLVGLVEFTVYSVEGTELETLLSETGPSRSPSSAMVRSLKTWVERHYDTVRADRQIGLGNSVQFETQVPQVIAFGHLPGLRYGFVTRVPSRPQIFERSLGYVASDGKWLYLITTSAPDSDAGGSFRTDAALQQFAPHLDKIVANLKLPRL